MKVVGTEVEMGIFVIKNARKTGSGVKLSSMMLVKNGKGDFTSFLIQDDKALGA